MQSVQPSGKNLAQLCCCFCFCWINQSRPHFELHHCWRRHRCRTTENKKIPADFYFISPLFGSLCALCLDVLFCLLACLFGCGFLFCFSLGWYKWRENKKCPRKDRRLCWLWSTWSKMRSDGKVCFVGKLLWRLLLFFCKVFCFVDFVWIILLAMIISIIYNWGT